jgi:hypothetical protein
MDVGETIARLEDLETGLLSLIENTRTIKAELQKAARQNPSLEPLLTTEEVAKLRFPLQSGH